MSRKEDNNKKKMGPPVKLTEEKIRQLEAILRLKPTLADCSAFIGVTSRAIEQYIRETHDLTYFEFREQKMVVTRFSLIRKALYEADNGNSTMLIFCLKNLCNWTDKLEHRIDVDMTIHNPLSSKEALEIIKNDPFLIDVSEKKEEQE